MSLRINSPRGPRAQGEVEGIDQPGGSQDGDGWASRLAKLIPAEALGLYGASSSIIAASTARDPTAHVFSLWGAALICLGFLLAIRIHGTRSKETGKADMKAVAISAVSFVLWLAALDPSTSPFEIPTGYAALTTVVALAWGTIVSYFYKGDSQ